MSKTSKSSKRVRPPKNLDDDDDEVEFFISNMEQFQANKAHLEEIVRNKSFSPSSLFDQVIQKLNEKDAVRILLVGRGNTTANCQLFESLLGDDIYGASELLKEMMGKHKTFLAAVPNIVDYAIKEGKISKNEREYFLKLFSTWGKRIKFNKCVMSPTNRPSLGSWNGWPWESMNIIEDCLLSDISGTNVAVCYKMGLRPAELFDESMSCEFKLIWSSADTEVNPNISNIVKAAITKATEQERQQPLKVSKAKSSKSAKKNR